LQSRLEDQLSEDRVYDGRKLGVSHRITRFYWYNKLSERLQVIRILAAKLRGRHYLRRRVVDQLQSGRTTLSLLLSR
jgi:hypothetical protein